MGTARQLRWSFVGIVLLLLGTATPTARSAPVRAEVTDSAVNFTALQPGQQAVAAVVLDIKPGLHAQSHTPSEQNYVKFVAKPQPNPAVKWLDPVYPAGTKEHYEGLGDLNVYTGRVTVYLPFEVSATAPAGDVKLDLTLHLQICDEKVCYAPQDVKATVPTSIVPRGQRVQPNRPELFKNLDPAVFERSGTSSATTQSAAGSSGGPSAGSGPKIFGYTLSDNSYGFAFAAAVLVGIILNAVPCVLPVLPLKAIGFYEVSQHNRAKSLAFGAVFSAGLIASFGVLALLVVVFRVFAWGEIYSNVWFSLAIVVILVVMAISTFGFFTVNLPPALYSISPRHDTYAGNFLFGILTAVLATPCTLGMLVVLLVWATRQPPVIGTLLVMTVGAGMALPYFVLSAFPELARRFPRTGPWSELVKQMMGFLLLGTAVFFARRFIQPVSGASGFWWVLFAVALLSAIFLVIRAFRFSGNLTPRLVTSIIAVLIAVPAFFAARSLADQPYEWKPYSQQALAEARAGKRVVVVEFTAAWCTNCQYLEKFVLDQKSVVAEVKRNDVEMIRADLTAADAPGWELLKRLNPVASVPFTAVYQPNHDAPEGLSGIYSIDEFRRAISRPASTAMASRS